MTIFAPECNLRFSFLLLLLFCFVVSIEDEFSKTNSIIFSPGFYLFFSAPKDWMLLLPFKKKISKWHFTLYIIDKAIFSIYLLGLWNPTHSNSWYVLGDCEMISVLAQVQHKVIMEVNLFSKTHCVPSEPNAVFIVITLCFGCYSHHCLFLNCTASPEACQSVTFYPVHLLKRTRLTRKKIQVVLIKIKFIIKVNFKFENIINEVLFLFIKGY